MGSNEDEIRNPSSDWTHPAVVLKIAEGILMERYQVSGAVANRLLHSSAATAELAVADVARQLVSTGLLPQPVWG